MLHRDDLVKPGHVIKDQLKTVAVRAAGGVRDAARLRGFPATRLWRGLPAGLAASCGGRLADLFRLLGRRPGC